MALRRRHFIGFIFDNSSVSIDVVILGKDLHLIRFVPFMIVFGWSDSFDRIVVTITSFNKLLEFFVIDIFGMEMALRRRYFKLFIPDSYRLDSDEMLGKLAKLILFIVTTKR